MPKDLRGILSKLPIINKQILDGQIRLSTSKLLFRITKKWATKINGLKRWLVRYEHLFSEHGHMSSNPQDPHNKLGVATQWWGKSQQESYLGGFLELASSSVPPWLKGILTAESDGVGHPMYYSGLPALPWGIHVCALTHTPYETKVRNTTENTTKYTTNKKI